VTANSDSKCHKVSHSFRPVREPDDLISVDEAALEFHRHRKTIFEWLQKGLLVRYVSLGDRRTLVSRSAVAELVRPRPKEPPV
jgi:hypothetical protein